MRRKSVIAMALVFTIIINFLPFNVVYGAVDNKLKIGVYTETGVIYESVDVDFIEGDTAYSALARVVGNVKTTGSGSGIYVSSIQGVAEFDGGPFSGWVYAVNGVKPEVSAGAYYLNPGDKLVWHYTLDLGEDIYLGINKLEAYIAANPPVRDEEVVPPANTEPEPEKLKDPVKEPVKEPSKETTTDKNSSENSEKPNSNKSEGTTNNSKDENSSDSVEKPEEENEDKNKENEEITKENKTSKEDINKSIADILERAKEDYGKNINSIWEAIALKNLGGHIEESYVSNILKEIKDNKGIYSKVTDLEKNMILLNLLGYDVRNISGINLLEILLTSDVEKQGSNGVIFALICLNSLDDEIVEEFNSLNREKAEFKTREDLVEILLAYQQEDGGFSLVKGKDSDIDITAMALQGLGGGRNLTKDKPEENSQLDKAISKALEYLKKCKFENSEAIAQTIIACAYIDEDPETFGSINLIEELLKYKNEDNKFNHILHSKSGEEGMASEQGVLALLSYENQKNGKPFIYEGEINRDETEILKEAKAEGNNTKAIVILSRIVIILLGAISYKKLKKINK